MAPKHENIWHKMSEEGNPKCNHAACIVYLKNEIFKYRFADYQKGKWDINIADTDFTSKDFRTIDSFKIEAYFLLWTTNGYYDEETHRWIEPEDNSEEWDCDWIELKDGEKPLIDTIVVTFQDGTHNPYHFGVFYDYPGAEVDWPFIDFTFKEPEVRDLWPEKYITFIPYKPIESEDYPVAFWDDYKGDYAFADIDDSIVDYIVDWCDGSVDDFIENRPYFANQKEYLKRQVAKEQEIRNRWKTK